MSALMRMKVEAHDATTDVWQVAETPVETNGTDKGTGPENEHSFGEPLAVRTLKDPPEIWDLVHEAPRDFNAGGAFVGRLTSSKINLIMLTLGVVFLSAFGLVAFKTLRDARNRSGAATVPFRGEQGTSQTVAAPQASAPTSMPVEAQLNTQLNTSSPQAGDGINNTPEPALRQTATDSSAASGDQEPKNSVQPTGENVSNASKLTATPAGGSDSLSENKRVTVASGARNADSSPHAARRETPPVVSSGAATQTPHGAQPAGVKQSLAKSSSDAAPTKQRSDTTSTPPLMALPATTSSAPNANTSKPKVIQWP